MTLWKQKLNYSCQPLFNRRGWLNFLIMKFTDGKWYLIEAFAQKYKYIAKYIKKGENDYLLAEYFIEKDLRKYNSCGDFNQINIIKEVPISEIQEYLPSGHVDKIKQSEYEIY